MKSVDVYQRKETGREYGRGQVNDNESTLLVDIQQAIGRCGCYHLKGDSDACFVVEATAHRLTIRNLFPPSSTAVRDQSSSMTEDLTHALAQHGINSACGYSAQTTDWGFVPKPVRRMTLFELRKSWRQSGCVNHEPFPAFHEQWRRAGPLSLRSECGNRANDELTA